MLAAGFANTTSRTASVLSLVLVWVFYYTLDVREQGGATSTSDHLAAVEPRPTSGFASPKWADQGDG